MRPHGIRILSISIHAPVKGATAVVRDGRCGLGISIHAPVKGATPTGAKLMPPYPFQSTLP